MRGRWFRGLSWGFAAIAAPTVLALWIPIFVMAVSSFNATRLGPAWGGLTLGWYRALGAQAADHLRGVRAMPLLDAASTSLVVALAVTVLAVGLGAPGAWVLRRPRRRLAATLHAALGVPLVLPDLLLGVSLLVTFRALGLELGLSTVVLGHLSFCLPFVLATVGAQIELLDPSLEAAALDLGATPARAFFTVILPALSPAVAGAALLTFALSLDELVVTYFTRGPGTATLPVVMYGMARVGVSPLLHAASTVLLGVTAVMVVGADRLATRQ